MANKRKKSVASKIKGREVRGGVLRDEMIDATQSNTLSEVKKSILFTIGAVVVVAILFILSSEFQIATDIRENFSLPKIF